MYPLPNFDFTPMLLITIYLEVTLCVEGWVTSPFYSLPHGSNYGIMGLHSHLQELAMSSPQFQIPGLPSTTKKSPLALLFRFISFLTSGILFTFLSLSPGLSVIYFHQAFHLDGTERDSNRATSCSLISHRFHHLDQVFSKKIFKTLDFSRC